MTIKELLDSVKALRANTYTDAELTAWLNRLERNVWHNLVVTHARFDGLPEELPVYDALTDDETELMIPRCMMRFTSIICACRSTCTTTN